MCNFHTNKVKIILESCAIQTLLLSFAYHPVTAHHKTISDTDQFY